MLQQAPAAICKYLMVNIPDSEVCLVVKLVRVQRWSNGADFALNDNLITGNRALARQRVIEIDQ
jgi:hypothetical protein